MRRVLTGLSVLALIASIVPGCARRALLVEPVRPDQRRVEGQTFCLAKGIVSLTVAHKPPAPKVGNAAIVIATGGTTFEDLAAGQIIHPASGYGHGQMRRANAAGAPAPKGGGTAPVDEDGGGSPVPGAVRSAVNNLTLSIDNVRFIPDCDFHYTVNLQHDIFHDDDVVVEIDPVTKLLKGVNAVLEDRTPEIVKRIAEAPGQILGGAGSLAPGEPVSAYEIKHDVDPTDPGSVAIFNAHLRNLSPGVKLVTRPLIELPHRPRERAHCEDDLCFRTALPYVVELRTTEGSVVRVVAQQIVVVPNPYLVANVPVTRAPFVKKEVRLDFKDGMLVKTHIKNPSEVLQFIGIPIDIAKAIITIPNALMKFEIVQTQNNAALLAEQKKVVNLQKDIIDAQRALLSAAAAK